MLGLVSLPVVLSGQELLVSDAAFHHIGEMLLGIDWLEEQQSIWNMRRGELHMHVSVFPLKTSKTGLGSSGSGAWGCPVTSAQ